MSPVQTRSSGSFCRYKHLIAVLIDLDLEPTYQQHVEYLSNLCHEYMGTGNVEFISQCTTRMCTMHDIHEFLLQMRLLLRSPFLQIDVLCALPMTLTQILRLCTNIRSMLIDLGALERPHSCMVNCDGGYFNCSGIFCCVPVLLYFIFR